MSPKHGEPRFPDWRKSSYSGGQGGECIEINETAELISVRDSKDKTGPTLAFTPQQWAAFIDFARHHNA